METLSSIQEKTADSHHEARKNEKSIYSLDWLIAPVKRAHPQVYDTLVPIWLRSFLQGKSFYKEKSFVSQTETICLETFPKQAQMMWNAVHAKNLSHTISLTHLIFWDTAHSHSIRICSISKTSAMDSFRSSTNLRSSSALWAQKFNTCFLSEPEHGDTILMAWG